MSGVGLLIGVLVDIVTPWSNLIIQATSSALCDPLITNNVLLSSLLHLVVWFTAYLLLPMSGAACGLFIDSK